MAVKARSFAEALDMVKAGTDCMVKCPAHEDKSESLHMSPGKTHPVIMKCFAECTLQDIMAASGFTMDEIMAERADQWKTRCAVQPHRQAEAKTPAGVASHIYEYVDENRNVLYEVLRVPQQGGGKTFRQRHRGPDGQWVWNLNDVRRVLYGLPEVIAAIDMAWEIWIVEGEKDRETLMAQFELHEVHAVATTAGGVGKWSPEFSAILSGATVVICADADEPGRKHARTLREELLGYDCDVTIKEAKQGCKDVTEHFEKGGKLGNLLTTVLSDRVKREQYGVDVLQGVKRNFPVSSFIIPNMLAPGERMLLTGFEGHGKSEMCRQFAAQAASGTHPWGGGQMTPRRVLFFDGENHPQQTQESWLNLLRLAEEHGRPVMPDMLTVIESWDDDIDILSPDGEAWFYERVTAFKPELIFLTPLYNLVGADLAKDEVVRKLKTVVNHARSIYSSAVVMEHHAPHKGPMDKKRTVRPYGSTMFLKWPDFGYGLQPIEEIEGAYEYSRLRLPRMRKRYFPEFVRWGQEDSMEWPWMEAPELEDDPRLPRNQ